MRLIRQFLTESVLLAIGGGLAGLALAAWGTQLLLALAGPQIPRYWEIGLDWRVFAFLLVICVFTGIAFGLAPALAASRVNVQGGMKRTIGRSQGRVRDALVVAEISLAFVLLMGAGLLLRAFLYLQATQTGLVTENVLTLRISASEARYGPSAPKGTAVRYFQALEDRMVQIPGVRSASFINLLPLQSWGRNGDVNIDGHPPSAPGRAPLAELRVVSPQYFRTLGIPLRRGREFNRQDTDASTPVAIINETLARRYFPNEDPIGRKTNRGTIVGIVADVRQVGLDQPPAAELYQPLSQSPQLAMTLAVATTLPVESVTAAVGAAVREVDSTQAIYNVKTMNRVVSESLSNQNLYLWLLGLFAGLALVLAIAGIYGVISYAVTARTQEFGIRLALGAGGSQVLRLVLWHGVVLVALGLALGVAGAFSLTRLLKAPLVGVTPTDPATFGVVGAVLAVVALAACLIPARRAMRVDPVIALRYE